MSAPLTTFTGFLKQVDRRSLDGRAECVLDRAFPLFWPGDPESDEAKRRAQAFREAGADRVFYDVNSPRRFAGCWTLPRARYFSLCIDDGTGDDRHTLVNELNAYLDPLHAGLLVFADMAVPEAWEQFRREFVPSAEVGPYLNVVLVGRPGAISPVIDELEEHGLIPHEANQQRQDRCLIGARIPYRVEPREIANVFDLRIPECQEYVVEEFFKKDTETLTKSNRSGISTFVESLPLLMHPALGGGPMAEGNGAILQAFAAFVRTQGANALIYPSARSDVLDEVRLGKVQRWRGWCLVDYTGAEEPLTRKVVDLSAAGWCTTFPTGAKIRFASGGEFAGSFEVRGIVKWNRDRVGEQEAEFVRGQQGS